MKQRTEKWIALTHMCRRWRSVVFLSPLHLNLQLVCTPFTRTREILDIWPPLPLIIRDLETFIPVEPLMEDNIIAALEHNDRVCKIRFINEGLGYFTNSAAILKPFPELTSLRLSNIKIGRNKEMKQILPNSFLGGSAPHLLHLCYACLSVYHMCMTGPPYRFYRTIFGMFHYLNP
jgi:hypothetical protein